MSDTGEGDIADKVSESSNADNGGIKRTLSGIPRRIRTLSMMSNSQYACTRCTLEATEFMLDCSKCRKLTHYACTQLPPYQLARFLQKSYRLYVCSACVGNIHQDIIDNASVYCEDLINKIKSLENELSFKTAEYERLFYENTTLIQQNKTLREQKNDLSNRLDMHDEAIDESQAKLHLTGEGINNRKNTMPTLSIDIKNMINERFDRMEENIDHIITQKLANNTQAVHVDRLETKLNEAISCNATYADKLKKNLEASNLASIIKETKNDDLVHKKEQELRSANFIIHGVSEEINNHESLKVHDEEFVSSFLEVIGTTSIPKQIVRLGKPDKDKKLRPLKCVMGNTADKENIMSRLINLKNADEVYRKVSVRDDYTIEEREQIKEWVKKAEGRNVEENTRAWKVRGTPRNGLRLVKINRQG